MRYDFKRSSVFSAEGSFGWGSLKLQHFSQDAFDHDKGQKSDFFSFLQWIFSFFCRFAFEVRKELPENVENLPDFRVEKKA